MTLTIPQAAQILGMSRQTLRVWIQKGKCPFGTIISEGKKKKCYYVDETRMNMWRCGAISNDGKKVSLQ